ncbi:hypothetical protein TNCV_3607301 [Trichonephila clavipes]|nr:hypothetical protein TNCV_3607301 [Trichonephila clavipes]
MLAPLPPTQEVFAHQAGSYKKVTYLASVRLWDPLKSWTPPRGGGVCYATGICSEDGSFGWLRNLHSNSSLSVLWDLDRGSEEACSVFEYPFHQTMTEQVSMCE